MQPFPAVHLELTGICNFSCHFCPIESISRPKQIMKKEHAFSLIEELATQQIATGVSYHLLGEPLLVPYLPELLAFAASKGLKNRFATNAMLLSKRKDILEIVRHCDFLDVSLRATTTSEFAAMCKKKNASFDDFLDGIRDFLRRVSAEHLNTQIKLGLFYNENCQALLARIGVDYRIPPDLVFKSLIRYNDNIVLYFETPVEWQVLAPKKRLERGSCQEYKKGFSILANGDVTPCAWDYDGQNKVGNTHDMKLSDILNGRKLAEFYHAFDQQIVPSDFCSSCSQLNQPVYKEKFWD